MNKRINLALRTVTTTALFWVASQTIQAQPYPSAVLADHPADYWRLQETSGTVAFDSAGSFNGVYTNALLGQAGYTAGSNPAELAAGFGLLAGQSAGSCVSGMPVDVSSGTATNFSVEAWVNNEGYSDTGAGIVGKGSGGGDEEFYLDCGGTSGAFRFFVRNAAGTAANASGSVIPDDSNWHYVVGVCNETNGEIYLYVDGVLNASNSVSGGIHASTNSYLNIGARQSGSGTAYTLQFSGDIGEVATYPYALSAAQVLTHYYAAGIPPVITVVPTNNVTLDEGTTLTLASAATGSPPLAYQWTTNGVAIGGQTNATLVLSNILASQFNGVSIILTVTNAYGSASDSGNGGTYVLVNYGAPQIVSSALPTPLSLYQGLSFTYSVSVNGTEPFYYQWFSNTVAIPTATNASYVAVSIPGTNTYSVNISNNYNGGSLTPSSTANLVGVPDPTLSYPSNVFAASPVAYWRLDESNGALVAYDYMGGHDGNYNSASNGLPGYSAFDPDTASGFGPNYGTASTGSGVNEIDNSSIGIPLIDFSQPSGSNAEFTVECWVKGPPTVTSLSGSCIVAKGNNGSEEFVLDASAPPGNKWRFYIRNAKNNTSNVYSPVGPDGNWHHLVGICDEANGFMALYVDGSVGNGGVITALTTNGLYSSTVPLSIGSQPGGSTPPYQFNGIIDEVAVYNYPLSAAEISAHFNAAPVAPYFTTYPPALVVAYRGENLTNTAIVAGFVPLTNQWYTVVGAVTNPVTGATNATLVLTNVPTGTNNYVFRSSNAFGSTNSPNMVVQVPAASGPPQLIADITPRPVALYAGLPLTYSVTASGSAPLAYQWYSNSVAIPGATNASLSFASLVTNDAASYYCVITNSISPYSTNSSTTTLAVIPAPTAPYPQRIIADHPVAYFRLDETAPTTNGYDYVGGNVGNYSNVLLNASGIYTNAWDADPAVWFGTNAGLQSYLGWTISNVDFAVPNGQNGEFTIEAWAKGAAGKTQLSGGAVLAKGVGSSTEQFSLDAHTGYRFYVRNAAGATGLNNAQATSTIGGSYNGTSWVTDGTWHHLVGICDQANSNLLLYIDGSLIGPNVITNGVVPRWVASLDAGVVGTGTNGTINPGTGIEEPTAGTNYYNSASSLSIGSRNKGSTSPGYQLNFNGAVDEVAFYNYVLTPLQVTNHYIVGKGFPVTLSLQVSNGNPQLTWSSAWVSARLESATNVTGPWVTIPNAATPYTVTNAPSREFYRLQLY